MCVQRARSVCALNPYYQRRLITAVCFNNSRNESSGPSCVTPSFLRRICHTPDSFTHSVAGRPLIDDSGSTLHPDSQLIEIRNKVWQRRGAICLAERRPVGNLRRRLFSSYHRRFCRSAAGLETTECVILIRRAFGRAAPAHCGWKSHK